MMQYGRLIVKNRKCPVKIIIRIPNHSDHNRVYLFVYYLRISNTWDNYKDWLFNDIQDSEVYEYIIVGAGSAGSVIASRLSEDRHKILLIEAGGMPPFFLNVPVITPALQESVYDWRYITTPQIQACKGLTNNTSIWPRGKIFGGSSRLNYMICVRGHPYDFEEWFPDYRESAEDDILNADNLRWSSSLAEGVLKGVAEMGHPVKDINKGHSTGFMQSKVFMKNGERWSSDRILQNRNEKELSIMTSAHVNRVLFESKKAVGIEFSKLKKSFKAFATKGVILSAGAIGTPQILMLSGVGPRKHLEDLKIDTVSDLPVGQNLMDHVITGIDLVTLNSSQPVSLIEFFNPLSMLEYFFYNKGLWSFNGIDVVGTFHNSLQKNKFAAPDLELMIMPIGISQDNGYAWRKAMGISDQVFTEYFAPLVYQNAVTLAPVLLHPKSLGEIKLRSKDPRDSPIIDPKYLSHKDDVRILVDGIKFVKKLLDTKAMKKLGATLYRKPFPGCEEQSFDSDEYWECYVRHLTLTCYHPAGTSSIGKVVDESFRVYNTRNLYVVDASVLPVLPSGNINAAVLMIAEKAARLFRQSKKNSLGQLSRKCSVFDVFLLCK